MAKIDSFLVTLIGGMLILSERRMTKRWISSPHSSVFHQTETGRERQAF